LAVVVTRLQPTVEVFFDMSATGSDVFTLDDPVLGELDAAEAILGGDIAVDISEYCTYVTVTRGRSNDQDEIVAGTLYVGLENQRSEFLPASLVESIPLTDDDGDPLETDDGDPLVNDYEAPFGPANTAPGRRVTVSVEGVVVFDGLVEDWDYYYRNDGRHTATLRAVDGLGALSRRQFGAWTTTAEQLPGARINDVLNRPEVDFAIARSIDTGVEVLQSNAVSAGTNVLTFLQLVAQSDRGRLFVDRFGTLAYRDRDNLVSSSVLAAFDDAGNEIPFESIDVAFGTEQLFNRVTVDRETGTAQTVNDSDSQSQYGTRALSVTGLLVNTDAQSLALATHWLSIYKQPRIRIARLSVNVDVVDAGAGDVMSLDIGDRVSVSWTPPGTETPIVQQSVVEGVSHRLGTNDPYVVELSLSLLEES
jgi:hypothetical protein